MKILSTMLFILIALNNIYAQKDVAESASGEMYIEIDSTAKTWDYGGSLGIFASQIVFVNWAAGGVNSISGVLNGDVFLHYKRKNHTLISDFSAEWGMIKNQGEPFLKNKDYFELNSKYGFQVDKRGKVFIGALLKFSSQFSEGIIPGEMNYSTNFLAPGRLVLAAGLDWRPNEMFSLFFSPAAGKFTFVTDNGVDETAFGVESGKKQRTEFGAYLRADFKKEIIKDLHLRSSITLFNNFLDNSQDTTYIGNTQKLKSNRGNIDIDWLVGADFVFNDWITFNISTMLVYDHDIKILLTEKDGTTPVLNSLGEQKTGPRTQFTQALNVGITYRFDSEKKEKKKKKLKKLVEDAE